MEKDSSGTGHPLPASDEARHNEIPEQLERDKDRGDDSEAAIQPDEAVAPDGGGYRYDDLGRGPDDAGTGVRSGEDQAAHQDRGQSVAQRESDRDGSQR